MTVTFTHHELTATSPPSITDPVLDGKFRNIVQLRDLDTFATVLNPSGPTDKAYLVACRSRPTDSPVISQGAEFYMRSDIAELGSKPEADTPICNLPGTNLVAAITGYKRFGIAQEVNYQMYEVDNALEITKVYDFHLVESPIRQYYTSALIGVSATTFLIAEVSSRSGAETGISLMRGVWNGTSIILSIRDVVPDPGESTNITYLAWAKVNDDEYLLFWYNEDDQKHYAVTCAPNAAITGSVTEVSATIGSPDTGLATAVGLNEDRVLVVYNKRDDDLYAQVLTVTSGSIALGTEATIAATGSGEAFVDLDMTKLNSGLPLLAYNRYNAAFTATTVHVVEMSVSGTTVTPGDDSDIMPPDSSPAFVGLAVIGAQLMIKYALSSAAPFVGWYVGFGDVAEGAMVLGGTMDGQYLYTTLWYQGQLALFVTDPSDLSSVLQVSLGDCDLAQVQNREYWAYPFIAYDGSLIVFGRMNDPASLGLAHVIWSADYGVSFALMEGGWGDDHCGAMINGPTDIFAIRNETSGFGTTVQAKLYSTEFPGETLSLISTLPFSAGVNPRALVMDFNDNIIAAADQADAQMVVYAPSPYTSWVDITTDHAADAGVTAVGVIS